MSKPKLSTKTPDKDDLNALISQHPRIIEHFNSREHSNSHIAIVELGATKVETFEGGEEQATIVIRHLELAVGAFEGQAEKLFTTIHRERTGNKSRPDFEAGEPNEALEGLDGNIDDSV